MISSAKSSPAAGFSLRKVATEAGVSPAAPSHHFGDTCGLLTAVAIEGFTGLTESFDAIDPDARLTFDCAKSVADTSTLP